MELENILSQIRMVNEQIQEIADKTGEMAVAGQAELSNPRYASLVGRLPQLFKTSSELNEAAMKALGKI
ncbi:TPA: hypothetical protein ACOJPN_004519 [Vibrio harveyi]|uniref:hypothetical protein n=1 Tax=Vibrio harveyi TaxID=669 RepID=UPI0039091C09